jgi:hypothetical protein
MAEQSPNPNDDFKRVIVLFYGMLENGNPFWLFAAVKPNRYQPMLAAQKDGTFNIYQFESYGEILISGEGKAPPDEITLKIAELYQTSPEELLKSVKEE